MQLHDPNSRCLYLTAEERRTFLVAAAKAAQPVRTLCGVLHTTGCRISKALALTPERDLPDEVGPPKRPTEVKSKRRLSGTLRTNDSVRVGSPDERPRVPVVLLGSG
jgi:hypothetical protein